MDDALRVMLRKELTALGIQGKQKALEDNTV